MNWVFLTLKWYFYLLLLGLIFFPLTKKLFNSFFDFGYSFAKTIGILVLSYIFFVLNLIKIAPFSQFSIFAILIFFLILNFILIKTHRKLQKKELALKIIFIVFEEMVFIGSLFFLTYVRSQEPSIRGLEKFMDFGFINSILRSKFFPPLDMWLSSDSIQPAGYPINYYYFGHLTGAILIKLSNIKPAIGYNLILATIFAQGITLAFSLCSNLIYFFNKKIYPAFLLIYGLLGTFLINFAGNLHTIYLFTKGYPNENPIPFWQIFSNYNPTKYWYPNATRFIPFTIHEFPSYSYVVADLHGHVFDIPFVLLTLAILLIFFTTIITTKPINTKYLILNIVLIGFMTSIHYMTNAFDGPIYILLTLCLLLVIFGLSVKLLYGCMVLLISFLFFSLPFSLNFSPFVSGVGVNCSPDFLTNIGKIGPFLFEKGNCQVSPFWMLFVLWGFFWISFFIFLVIKWGQKKISSVDYFVFILFLFGIFLVLIPEFFYIKDIYPAHFRANTMFKLGYQAFIMMAASSIFVFSQLKTFKKGKLKIVLSAIFIASYLLVSLYSFFSFPSYYGNLNKKIELDGSVWFENIYPQDKEIIDYLNKNIKGQPVILEAQGDSYTDYERISAYTGLPTVAGWWVHEWLWRGSSDVVGSKIQDIVNLYESSDLSLTKQLIDKYKIKYVIVSQMEKEKYKNLNENKFFKIGKRIFISSDKKGAIYQLK